MTRNLQETNMDEQPNMPKVTPGVWISLVTAILGVLTSFGLDLETAQQAAIVVLATAVATVVPIVEAWLRKARLVFLGEQVRAAAKVEAAQAAPATTVINNEVAS